MLYTQQQDAEAAAYKSQKDAEAAAMARKVQAEASLNAQKMEADGAAYTVQKAAEADLIARTKEAEAAFIERWKEAEGLTEMAKAYGALANVLGGPQVSIHSFPLGIMRSVQKLPKDTMSWRFWHTPCCSCSDRDEQAYKRERCMYGALHIPYCYYLHSFTLVSYMRSRTPRRFSDTNITFCMLTHYTGSHALHDASKQHIRKTGQGKRPGYQRVATKNQRLEHRCSG